MSGGPEEREAKLRVEDDFALPDLATIDGVRVADRGEQRLHAVYWDTADLGLARSGSGLRRRNDVWTFKGVSHRDGHAVVREEVEVSGGASIPAVLLDRLQGVVDAADLRPVAELEALRHTLDLSCEGEQVELVHDRVRVIDGEREVCRFAEVEVEYQPSSTRLADRVVALLLRHGAIVDPTPKLVRALRALGHNPPVVGAGQRGTDG